VKPLRIRGNTDHGIAEPVTAQPDLRVLEGLPPNASCPACGSRGLEIFHEQRDIPVHATVVLDSREEALGYPTGDMQLGWCRSCGFISNPEFDDRLLDYAGRHEESQGFSPHFQTFARGLARRWIDRYGLAGKTVVEIGCGKGHFLEVMIAEGVGKGIGVDPGCGLGRVTGPAAQRIQWVQEYYSPTHDAWQADAIVCRHTLEHVHDVAAFLDTVRRSLGDRRDVAVLFEVPDALRVLREVAFWDIYYEHCGYFTAGSLARAFRASGFDILDLELVYSGQYLVIEARPRPEGAAPAAPLPQEEAPQVVEDAIAAFRSAFAERIVAWRERLRRARSGGKRGVIWGGGSKGMGYLTALGPDAGIDVVVDINPHLQGRYMPGTGQQVVAPEFLQGYRPDFVVVMNPVYVEEIRAMLERLGLAPTLLTA
jgi:SAM-dependent methyltransferase